MFAAFTTASTSSFVMSPRTMSMLLGQLKVFSNRSSGRRRRQGPVYFLVVGFEW